MKDLIQLFTNICLLVFLTVIFPCQPLFSQISVSNPNAEDVIFGNYNPGSYHPSILIYQKDSVIDGIIAEVSEDSLLSYLIELEKFGTRNSASDTISNIRGIGAARRWIHSKLVDFSARNENRLQVGYLEFTSGICGTSKHKNVFGVLPGLDTTNKELIVIEAHMDSRCESSCDTSCYAPGMDDNGSGTVLVIELARIMSRFAFDRSILFTTVTGEEQGLRGGQAWANYLSDNNIDVLACLNNDVVGGIDCGQSSSPPSCSPVGSLDSMNLRVFSYSPFNDSNLLSKHKQLARYIKLQQIEEINPRIGMNVNLKLQIREDRVGRGGDHIPFRQKGYHSIRFTSSHEHGNGSGQTGDRQHTVNDVLGFDTSIPPDGILDTFLINFSYLKRNTITNGINLALLANSPPEPNPVYILNGFGNTQAISFEGLDSNYSHRIGIRRKSSPSLYFDTVLSFSNHLIDVSQIFPKGDVQLHCMNTVRNIESIPVVQHSEKYLSSQAEQRDLSCLEVHPNPSNDHVKLRWKCAVKPVEAELFVYGISGSLFYNTPVKAENLQHGYDIDVSSYQKGAYEIVLILNNEKFTQKIIVK